MEKAENIIELANVDAGYPGAVILHDVSFEVRRGEIFILLGGSGCGKSTVMKHMIGLNPVLAGTLRVAGLKTKSTADGVGVAATAAVVGGIVAIAVADGILAVLCYVWNL